MKKIYAVLLAAALLVSIAGCTNGAKEKSLYEQGMELISLMAEMTRSESYRALYTASPEIQEILSSAGQGDYSSPAAVYQITLSEEQLLELTGAGDVENLPLKNYVISRANTILFSQVNAEGGAQVLAASSICAAGKTFVSKAFSGNTVYLYVFENGTPVAVSFLGGEDHTVSASGNFLFTERFQTGVPEALDEYLRQLGTDGAQISVLNL